MNTPPKLGERSSGILLHPTSLPGPFGAGDLGPEAHRFIDWLASAGQSWWQMLPVVPPSGGASPYTASSAFAGNPYLVSLEFLRDEGLLSNGDLAAAAPDDGSAVDFGRTWSFREARLRAAFDAFRDRGRGHDEFTAFCQAESAWLDDYALFSALKSKFNNTVWTTWDEPLRARRPDALAAAARDLASDVRYHKFVQFCFARQWRALRAHGEHVGVGLIGDIPIFVGHDSADVWANPGLYFLRDDGEPTVVAGVPPDYFSATGQRWGNPLYRWEEHARTGYAWWISRFRSMLEKFHAVRIDHFIGFHRYWEIKSDCPTAVDGRYLPGPGASIFEAVEASLGKIPVIAEDLGVVTPEVKALRDRFSFPGMRVLQFAFGTDNEARNYQPHSFPRNCVVYTGTHDNDTTRGWFDDVTRRAEAGDGQARAEREFLLRYVDSDGRDIVWDLIRLGTMSSADTAIFPMQDVLDLDTRARMNLPGSIENNWSWRMSPGQSDTAVAARLKRLAETYARTRF